MNVIINGPLKHHLACVQEEKKNGEWRAIGLYIFRRNKAQFWVCEMRLFARKKKYKNNKRKMRGKWNKKSHLVLFQLSKKKYLISSHLHWIHIFFIRNEYARTKFFKTSKSIFVQHLFCECLSIVISIQIKRATRLFFQ